MRIDILTLFPNFFEGPFRESIVERAQSRGLISIALHDIRDYAAGRHRVVDDYPYGGGPGMVMKPEPIAEALDAVAGACDERGPVVLLTPQGRLFDQATAGRFARGARLTLLCGRYEGVDERVRALVDEEVSIGDFVLSGGEAAAVVVVDAVMRLVPGVLGSEESLREESHASGLLEYPQYTRPPSFRGWDVPAILLSGNHQEVARWRRLQSILRTRERRPDLLARAELSATERAWLERLQAEELESACRGRGSEAATGPEQGTETWT